MSTKPKITMHDVAKEAGVSIGTVSNVINNNPVGVDYKRRVEAAISKLDYQVNTYAKALKSNKSNSVAFILPNTVTPFFAALTQYINEELAIRGMHMLLTFTNYDLKLEQDMIKMVQNRKVAGIIALTYNPDLIIPDDIPFVTIDRFFSKEVPCVSSDNYGGGRLAAQKLHELGCKNLVFFRIGSSLTNEPNKRKDGFVSYCNEFNIPYELKILDDHDEMDEFYQYIDEHITEGEFQFDGIFCVTDSLAHLIRKHLEKRGITAPTDVQLIGFDGTKMFGTEEYYCSSIVQPVEEIARTCVDLVLKKEKDSLPSLISLPVHYTYGGTTHA